METKGQLVEAVKNWIQLDNELREIAKLAKEKREEKKQVSIDLMNMMKNNEIECLDINDGQLCYKKRKCKKPLNKDTLLMILHKYFNNESKGMDAAQFILDNREIVDKETISRKINKS
tara:strand:- start:845 stop:1198 length:354 start_codon:yes stop_codon:yes gene_type:complete